MIEKRKKTKRFSFSILIVAFFLGLSVTTLAIALTFQIAIVGDEEMAPTLLAQEILAVSSNERIRRFDLVYFTHPDPGEGLMISRVIGLAGEELYYKNDQLYVDEEELVEDYLAPRKTDLISSLLTADFTLRGVTSQGKIPAKSYFVLGDNRQIAQDSREFGFVHEEQIKGKVSAKLWPLGQLEIY